jgi:hypothetical protein
MESVKTPRGIDLLRTLIELYADQEGVKITYELKEVKHDEQAESEASA